MKIEAGKHYLRRDGRLTDKLIVGEKSDMLYDPYGDLDYTPDGKVFFADPDLRSENDPWDLVREYDTTSETGGK